MVSISSLFFLFEVFCADIFDSVQVADTVGAEDKAEYPGNKIVQLFAIFEVLKINTPGAGGAIFFLCARLYFAAEVQWLIAVTAAAFAFQICPALGANQPAVSQNKFF